MAGTRHETGQADMSPTRRFVASLVAFGVDDVVRADGKGANLGELIQTGYWVPDALSSRPTPTRRSSSGPWCRLGSRRRSGKVLDAVRRCWASLWTDRAIAYRHRRGIGAEDVRMAVVVQAMVEADIAGVVLTANPVTGVRDETVVDASSGLGEAVVSGQVTPDHYVLDSGGRVREWTPGQREVVIRGAPGGGVTRDTTQPAEARRLTDNELAELARSVRRREHFGRPQDIEWAWAHKRVWLLQQAVDSAPAASAAAQSHPAVHGGRRCWRCCPCAAIRST